MILLGIGSGIAILLALWMLVAKLRHDRSIGLIQATPVTTVADLVKPAAPAFSGAVTIAAVLGRVAAVGTERLTAPITGDPCVAYKVRVYEPSGNDKTPDTEYIVDSAFVPWVVDDQTGLANVGFNPFDGHGRGFFWWRGTQYKREEYPFSLAEIISHYGPDPRGDEVSKPYKDLSWSVEFLSEYGNEVFLLSPCTIKQGCAHFDLDSESIFRFGTRHEALTAEQEWARDSVRWARIWTAVAAILGAVFLVQRHG
jgi:hypothetical protein